MHIYVFYLSKKLTKNTIFYVFFFAVLTYLID
jgi:hypothetical protein